jgi:hypothetical protein
MAALGDPSPVEKQLKNVHEQSFRSLKALKSWHFLPRSAVHPLSC